MATLEKIRNKSVLLIVIIGVALLAFILGDFFSSGKQILFGNANTVAKVGGSKIDIQDYQKRYNEESQMMAQNQENDGALVQQDVLDEMVNEKLLDNEFEDLGIEVTDDELSDFMIGNHASQDVMQFTQSIGAQSPAQAHDMIFNPAKYQIAEQQVAPIRDKWLEMERQTESMLKRQKLAVLVMGGIQANDLDILEMQNENQINNVDLVKKDYASLNDKDFPVTDAEIKAQYDKHKNRYILSEEVRKISYIAVDVVPSKTDEAAAKVLMDTVVYRLQTNPGIESARTNGDLDINEGTFTLASADKSITEFLKTAEVGSVSPLTRAANVMKVTKVTGKKFESDSVKINMVAIEGNKAMQDSVLKMLNSGMPLAEISKVKGVQAAQPDQWIDLTRISAQDVDAKNKVLAAGAEYFAIQSTDQAASFCQVTEKKAPKQIFEIAEVSYKVLPSETTKQSLLNNLENFANKNQDVAKFKKNAIPVGYQVVESYITEDMPRLAVIPDMSAAELYAKRVFNIRQVESIPNSRRGVQWAFQADNNTISPVFDKENNNKYIVVAVEDIIPEGYIPVTDAKVRAQLTSEIRKDKKADKLIAMYKGKAKDINGYAALMGSAVTKTGSSFANGVINMIGVDASAAGWIAGSKPNKLMGPTKGDLGVYVYQVTSSQKDGLGLSKEEAANRYNATMGGQVILRGALQILREKNKVESNLGKFYNNNQD